MRKHSSGAMLFPCILILVSELTPLLGENLGKNSSRYRITFRHGRGRLGKIGEESQDSSVHCDDDRRFRILNGAVSLFSTDKPTRPGISADPRSIREAKIIQKLDHFDGTNSRSWAQRYVVNDRYYQPGGPVFLYISSGAFDPYWIGGSGYLPDWLVKARKFKALCFFLEHRYYGESKPTKNLSVQNLRYMTTYQALSDIANFIVNITSLYHLDDSPWVLFGCSYAGSLASWARLKYPHLVSVAVASGAPMEARLDFAEYAEMVDKVLQSERDHCSDNIRLATDTIENWLTDSKKLPELKKMFSICSDEELDPTDNLNMSVFFAHLAENIFNVVQNNKINMGAISENLTIAIICDMMGDTKLGDMVSRYAAVQNLILSVHEKPCFSISYSELIEALKYVGYDEDWRQWSFQACSEFGFHPTSSSPYQPFGHRFDLDYYLKQCKDIFGFPATRDEAENNVKETQRQYGDRNSKNLAKVILTYGTHDPWSALTATEAFRSMKVIPIEGASHCADFFTPDDATDSQAIKSARQQVDKLLKRWLENDSSGGRMTRSYSYVISFFCLCIVYMAAIVRL